MYEDEDEDEDGNHPHTYEDLTVNKNPNTKKQKNVTKGMVSKFFQKIKSVAHPYDNLESLPPGYDFVSFFGKFCDFRKKEYNITKLGGLIPSMSNLYGMIIKQFPDAEKNLHTAFVQLKKTQMQLFIHKALTTNTALVDSSPLPNPPDYDYIGEQLWLGGANDAIYRFAFQLNCHCGGRVSEVRKYNVCHNNFLC